MWASHRKHAHMLQYFILIPTGWLVLLVTKAGTVEYNPGIATGFNQKRPPDRTVCVAVDLSASFNTGYNNNLCRRSTDHSSIRPQRDGSPVILEENKPRLASQMYKQRLGKSKAASHKVSKCYPRCSAITLLTC